jgi:hypothetical protein
MKKNSSYIATIFKPTHQNSSGRLRVGGFGVEIWNIGDDMIISMETAVSSISNKVLQLHLVQSRSGKPINYRLGSGTLDNTGD